MKKIAIILLMLLSFCGNAFAASAEKVAGDALKAYQTRDVDLLKSHMVGMFKLLVTEDYFDKKSAKKYLDAVKDWDGTFKEVRYQSGDMAGVKMQTALVYFADDPKKNDTIYAVSLSSKDGKNWSLFSDGLITESKEEFEKFSLDQSASKVTKKPEVSRKKNFSTEMANGETSNSVTETMLKDSIESLNDDNFFLILTDKEDFIQVSYSDKGYDIQYKENGVQYVARDYLTKEQAIEAFITYFKGKNDWKKMTPWDKM